jgi:AhpD family alkylhydroperoxidase
MKTLRTLRAYFGTLRRGRRNQGDFYRWTIRRPALLIGMATYETASVLSNRVDLRLKYLAATKAATLTTCEYCMDMSSSLCRGAGVTDEELAELPRYRTSDRFTDLEKLALDLAVAMTSTPAIVPDQLRAQLLEHLSRTQLVELAAAIALENHWSRLNQALGVRPAGFSDGAFCVRAELPDQTLPTSHATP